MKSCIVFVLVALCVAKSVDGKREFPPYITVCKNNADVSKCVLQNIDACRPYLKEGIPALTVPPLEPLKMESMGIDTGVFQIQGTDFAVYNLDNFEVLNLDVDVDKNYLSIGLRFPRIDGRGKYTIKGKILLLELDGAGISFGNISDIHVEVTMKGIRENRKGKEHVKFTDTNIKLTFNGPVFLYFEDLFKGREDLTRSTNQIINDNIVEFLGEIRPVIEQTLGTIVTQIVSRLFDKFPIDELFPK